MIMRKKKIDFTLLISITLLLVIGLTFIYTASSTKAVERFADDAYFLKRQLLRVFLGLVGM
ncbi:MAG: stage V sporulation protein E, partial [Calditrichaeota bacterium]